MRKKIVFDMDDILWGLNERASKIVGVEYDKLVCFRLEDNPYLTPKQRRRLLALYRNPKLWKDIEWYEGATDIKKLEEKGYAVYIHSNSMTKQVQAYKRIISTVFDLPEKQIILDVSTEAKKPLRNVLIFCDDNVANNRRSKAKYKVFLDKPWNKEMDEGEGIIRCSTFRELMDTILKIIEKEQEYA